MIKYLSDLVCKITIPEKESQEVVVVILMEEYLLLIMEGLFWNGVEMLDQGKVKLHFLMLRCLKGMLILLVK